MAHGQDSQRSLTVKWTEPAQRSSHARGRSANADRPRHGPAGAPGGCRRRPGAGLPPPSHPARLGTCTGCLPTADSPRPQTIGYREKRLNCAPSAIAWQLPMGVRGTLIRSPWHDPGSSGRALCDNSPGNVCACTPCTGPKVSVRCGSTRKILTSKASPHHRSNPHLHEDARVAGS